MILRRIADHLKQQHWTGVFIELVIVVLGVFLGMQAQEWSKGQDDRRSEKQIIRNLLDDLELDRASYAGGVAADDRIIGAANASLVGAGLPPLDFDQNISAPAVANYALDLKKISGGAIDRRDRLWTDVVIAYFPTPSTVTYDAMVGSGDFKIVGNRAIVRDIQTYHNLTDTVGEQNSKLMTIRLNTLKAGADVGLAPFVNVPVDDYLRLVASHPPLAAAIRIQATFAIYHRGESASADARAALLQTHLKSYLKAGS